MKYDPERAPQAEEWLRRDEAERLDAVLRYHKQSGMKADGLKMHCVIHTAIENQLAEGHPGATGSMARLMREGLERHDAVHALGVALAEQLLGAAHGRAFDAGQYERALRELTAESWRALGAPE